MTPHPSLIELQFSRRAFLAYLNQLLLKEASGLQEIEQLPIKEEIKRTEQRVSDLDILIDRKSNEA
jgi:hypothetical protein